MDASHRHADPSHPDGGWYGIFLSKGDRRKRYNHLSGGKSRKERDTLKKPMSGLGFKLMSLMFKVRDMIRPRSDVLKEAGMEHGFAVLDFGCGPGGYIAPLVELVGPSGKIYAPRPIAECVTKTLGSA